MLWKSLILLSVIAILVGGGIWVSHGAHIFTKDREKVVEVTHDPIFGTEVEEVTWKETFDYGLLPDHDAITHLHRSYAFVLGLSTAVIIGSLIMIKRGKARS